MKDTKPKMQPILEDDFKPQPFTKEFEALPDEEKHRKLNAILDAFERLRELDNL